MSIAYGISRVVRFLSGHPRPFTTAIILAAGSGKRMESEVPKQFLLLRGMPVLAHTMLAFQQCKYIDEIIVVTRNEDSAIVRELAKEYKIKKFTHTVCGGDERFDSVMNGMTAVGEKTGFVAIHDAARCLVTPRQIAVVVSTAYAYNAASAGSPVKDTVKKVSPDGFIIETPERSLTWNASTPQVFCAAMYRAAAVMAKRDGLSPTDDNMVIEHIGQRIKMVNTGYENLKLTTKEDIPTAETILKKREEEKETQKKGKKK